MSNVRRIRPTAVAHTTCPNGHADVTEAISPVFQGGELVSCYWSSAIDFCMECEQPIAAVRVEVSA